jgi:ribosome modulation factor
MSREPNEMRTADHPFMHKTKTKGYEAFLAGQNKEDNPYEKKNRSYWTAWRQGWDDAAKDRAALEPKP